MTTDTKRLNLRVVIFDKEEPAQVLPELTPAELVAAILAEFREIDYLGSDPSTYGLVWADSGEELNADQPLHAQVSAPEQRIRLIEHSPTLPFATQPMGRVVYLRELSAGIVYRLHWQPAIIGRRDAQLPQGELVAVDLRDHVMGRRVSRRHAQIIGVDGVCYIEPIGDNPVAVVGADGIATPLTGRYELKHNDIIELTRSQIKLRVLLRDQN